MSDSSSLSDVRAQIDQLDEQIQQLINHRARLAFTVGEAKGAASDFYRPEREAEVLRGVLARNQGPLGDADLTRLFREIMSACLAQQEALKVAYLGPEGTFTQQAVYRQFGHSVNAISLASIEDVFLQVQGGDADMGVVPVENSTQGVVTHTFDMLLDSELKICGEIELRIHQNLLSHAKSLNQIERVYSHQQSLAQCRHWLRRHLSEAECIPVSSNAEAARRVRSAPDSAAIASRAAARVYGLPVLFSDIEDEADNTTRFLVIGRKLLNPSGRDKTSLLLAGKEGPGALVHLLNPLAESGINMTRIESRPSKLGKWDYVFFIDVEGHAEQPPLSTTLADLTEASRLLKVLGSYPRDLSSPAHKDDQSHS